MATRKRKCQYNSTHCILIDNTTYFEQTCQVVEEQLERELGEQQREREPWHVVEGQEHVVVVEQEEQQV